MLRRVTDKSRQRIRLGLTVDAVDDRGLVVAAQQEEVLRVFDLVAEEERDHLQPARDTRISLIVTHRSSRSTLNADK